MSDHVRKLKMDIVVTEQEHSPVVDTTGQIDTSDQTSTARIDPETGLEIPEYLNPFLADD